MITEEYIKQMLRDRYQLPEWALVTEVADETGANTTRFADAIAVNCYPSRGQTIEHFEIKCDRADWLREMNQPEKTAAFSHLCHKKWIVCEIGIVKLEEIPMDTGWLRVTPHSLRVMKQAHEYSMDGIPIGFLASLARAITSQTENVEEKLSAARLQGYTKAMNGKYKKNKQAVDKELKKERRIFKAQASAIKKFEESSGVNILDGCPSDIGDAVSFVLNNGISSIRKQIEPLARIGNELIRISEKAGELISSDDKEKI